MGGDEATRYEVRASGGQLLGTWAGIHGFPLVVPVAKAGPLYVHVWRADGRVSPTTHLVRVEPAAARAAFTRSVVETPENWNRLAVGELTGDGNLDVVAMGQSSTVVVYPGVGNGLVGGARDAVELPMPAGV